MAGRSLGLPSMRTIGARLTLLYVAAVAGTIVGVLLLGRYVLERHLVGNLDASLQQYFTQLRDRLGTDTEPDEVRTLLSVSGVQGDLAVEVEDLWNDPDFQAARAAGTPSATAESLRYFSQTNSAAVQFRIAEGANDSLKIRLSLPLAPVQRALDEYTRVASGMALFVLLLSLIAGHLLSRAALRPVQLIERTATRISSDNLSERIPVREVRDEISNLSRLLNQTFERLESSFQQIKRFSADASHELKTPLSLVRLNLERIVIHGSVPEDDREALQDCIEEINHLDRLIENLLFLSRVEAQEVKLQRQIVNVSSLIETFSHDALILAEAAGARFEVSDCEAGQAEVDPARVRQVLLNVLSNAIKFSPVGGMIRLSSTFADGTWILRLTDDGPGVPDDKLDAIFQRFVRISGQMPPRRSTPPGTGLGLAISRSIVELHGGTLEAMNRRDRSGLVIECRLGVQQAATS